MKVILLTLLLNRYSISLELSNMEIIQMFSLKYASMQAYEPFKEAFKIIIFF